MSGIKPSIPHLNGPIIGYLHSDDDTFSDCINSTGEVRTWRGKVFGRYRVLSAWRMPLSHPISDVRVAVIARIENIYYYGRGYGHGCNIALRAYRDQKQTKRKWDAF